MKVLHNISSDYYITSSIMETKVIFFICCILLQVALNTIEARAIAEAEGNALTPLSTDEKKCVRNLHLNEVHILELNNADVTTEDDDQYNKFLECYWKDQGIQDNNGNVNYDALSALMQKLAADELEDEDEIVVTIVKGLAEAAVTYCKEKGATGTTHGQTCVKAQNCIMSKLMELIEDL